MFNIIILRSDEKADFIVHSANQSVKYMQNKNNKREKLPKIPPCPPKPIRRETKK